MRKPELKLAAAALALMFAAMPAAATEELKGEDLSSQEQATIDEANMDQIKRGLELSQLLCMKCHAITGPGPGTEEKSPPFTTLVEKLTIEGVADQLLEGLPMGHEPMPKWEFSEQQAEDLLLFIEYIGRKKTLE